MTMPSFNTNRRRYSLLTILVVTAVAMLHVVVAWALFQLIMPVPSKPLISSTAPIEIELVTLPLEKEVVKDASKVSQLSTESPVESSATTIAPKSNSASHSSGRNTTPTNEQRATTSRNSAKNNHTRPSTNSNDARYPVKVSNLDPSVTINKKNSLSNQDNHKNYQAPNPSLSNPQSGQRENGQTNPATQPSQNTDQSKGVANEGDAMTSKVTIGSDKASKGTGKQTDEAVRKHDNETNVARASISAPFTGVRSDAKWTTAPNFKKFESQLWESVKVDSIVISVSIPINAQGKPTEVVIHSNALSIPLQRTLINSIKQARLEPFIREGRAVAGVVKVTLRMNRNN